MKLVPLMKNHLPQPGCICGDNCPCYECSEERWGNGTQNELDELSAVFSVKILLADTFKRAVPVGRLELRGMAILERDGEL